MNLTIFNKRHNPEGTYACVQPAFLTSNIEQSVQGHNSRTRDGHLERLCELPGVGVRVVALHRVQARASLPTSHCVHKAIQHHQA